MTNDQTTLCNAVALSLAAALIEAIRTDINPTSALGNRLSRACEATETAIEYFPRVRTHFDGMQIADQLLDPVQTLINRVVVHGGFQRGERDLIRFNQAILERLNDPKNVAKGDYLALSWIEVKDKLREELAEVEAEMWTLALGQGDPAAAVRECADLATMALICAAKVEACKEARA